MARAYTAELRDRVPRACEHGGLSRVRVAALFGVGESTLYRWLSSLQRALPSQKRLSRSGG
jgi:transposase